ncbi:MAG: UTP--glucose-1-phosphate uridylyltransferase [Opitutales bacterium]
MSITSSQSAIERFQNAGQGHVFAWFNELSEEEQNALLAQADSIDLAEVQDLVDTLVKGSGEDKIDFSALEPSPYEADPTQGGDAAIWAEAKAAGEAALKAGRVAAFCVAGGQGTRLGYDGPKGTFPVTPVNAYTLFQVFAEKILAASKAYGVSIPWFIMTSKINHEATVSFFEENDYLGLKKEDVTFFSQGLMPAVDYDGKIILSGKGEIAMTPDGHGGSLRALYRSGATAAMAERGIDIISYFQVDNPLVRCIDPAFVGFHALRQSEMSSKMVKKAYAAEKVGLFCELNGQGCVVEYSDMPQELNDQVDADGNLRFEAGSIAIHILDRAFVERLGSGASDAKMPFHRADKKIPFVDGAGALSKPEKPNGVKFEMFVFDALPFAKNPVVIETLRQDDFSPVKNAEGLDSPKTSREDQMRQFVRWMSAAGIEVSTDETGLPEFDLEISPLFATDADSFAKSWAALESKPVVESGLYLK